MQRGESWSASDRHQLLVLHPIPAHALMLPTVNWLDHGRTLREQGIDDNETLLLRRKFFYSDQNVDSRDPVQLNLLYVQVHLPGAPGTTALCQPHCPLPAPCQSWWLRVLARSYCRVHFRMPSCPLGKSQCWQSQPCPLPTPELP